MLKLLGNVEAGPKWFFIVSYVAGHYTCPCLVHLLMIELTVLQTNVLLLSYREVFPEADRPLLDSGLKTALRPYSAGPEVLFAAHPKTPHFQESFFILSIL